MRARENPFRSECIEALSYRAPEFDWNRIEVRLQQIGGRGAIIGPKGHGKTTLLEQWNSRHSDSHYFRIAERQRRLTAEQQETLRANSRAWIFVDSAEQLGWFGWRELRRLISPDSRLIITTHRVGRLPTLHRCETSPELMRALVAELTGLQPDCRPLWLRHRGNLREAFRELYDVGVS